MRAVEVGREPRDGRPHEIPWHLAGGPGSVSLRLLTTTRRLFIGSGLSRRAGLVDAVGVLPGLPEMTVSPSGGTFAMGGPRWLHLDAVGVPGGSAAPIDWMTAALVEWFGRALAPLGIAAVRGRVDGAWCPGFSDLSAGGGKLVGMGFRVRRGGVYARAVVAVRALSPADLALLGACHALIGAAIARDRCASIEECTADRAWSAERLAERWRSVATGVP